MRISFRQGLISFQRDSGLPVYLQPSTTAGFVSHVITPTPTVVAFAHGSSDYLAKFVNTTMNAWGPIVPGITNHLYWDIDQLTAVITRGLTTIEPIYSETMPPAPVNDQHWFDKTETLMKVWSVSKNKWLVKIRLFAGRVMNGNLNTIMMFNNSSQAGLVGPANPGFILLDSLLHPLRKASQHGEFLTDDDEARVMSTVGTAGVLVQPVNKVVPVRAGEALPKMSLVYFSADDTVKLASSNPTLILSHPPVGIMVDAIDKDDIGSLVQSGEISYDQWDFSGNAGKPVYCDSFGQITMVRPAGLMAFRVGFIKNSTTLLVNIDAETYPQVYTVTTNQLIVSGEVPVSTTDAVNGLGERVVTIAISDVNTMVRGLMPASLYNQVITDSNRISTIELTLPNKSDVGHTHVLTDVTGLTLALSGGSGGGSTPVQMFVLSGSQKFNAEVHAFSLVTSTSIPTPIVIYDAYSSSLIFQRTGIYKITVSLKITPPVDFYGPGFWPDGLTAFGSGIYLIGSGSIFGTDRTTHTRFSIASANETSSHGIGIANQSECATDIYHVNASNGTQVQLMSYTAIYAFGSPDIMTHDLVITVEQIS